MVWKLLIIIHLVTLLFLRSKCNLWSWRRRRNMSWAAEHFIDERLVDSFLTSFLIWRFNHKVRVIYSRSIVEPRLIFDTIKPDFNRCFWSGNYTFTSLLYSIMIKNHHQPSQPSLGRKLLESTDCNLISCFHNPECCHLLAWTKSR